MRQNLFLFVGAILMSLLFSPQVAAQETTETPVPVLHLGDEVTGTLAQGERARYSLDLEGVDQSVADVLFPTADSLLTPYDDQGHSIGFVDRIGEYGHEVFTWQPGGKHLAEVVVAFQLGYPASEYSLSILPSESGVSEDP